MNAKQQTANSNYVLHVFHFQIFFFQFSTRFIEFQSTAFFDLFHLLCAVIFRLTFFDDSKVFSRCDMILSEKEMVCSKNARKHRQHLHVRMNAKITRYTRMFRKLLKKNKCQEPKSTPRKHRREKVTMQSEQFNLSCSQINAVHDF